MPNANGLPAPGLSVGTFDLGRWLDGTYQLASDEEEEPISQDKDIP